MAHLLILTLLISSTLMAQSLAPRVQKSAIIVSSNDASVHATTKVHISQTERSLTLKVDSPLLKTNAISATVRKKLGLVIPISVPSGKRLKIKSLSEVALLSISNVQSTPLAKIHSEAFLAGGRGLVISKRLTLSQANRVLSLHTSKTIIASCGEDVSIRLEKYILSNRAQLKSSSSLIRLSIEDCL